jgi:xylitol oxidase
MNEPISNWAGNFHYSINRVLQPESLQDLKQLVTSSAKLRVVGSRHSFNAIADSNENLVSLKNFDRVLKIDDQAKTVTVEGGVTYGQLSKVLHAAGFALHNLASLPHISIVGAVSTATHGSGDRNGNLATAVRSLELLTSSGELLELSGDQLQGTVVSLGALGIVTKITLAIEPAYSVQQEIFERLPWGDLYEHFDELMQSQYSVSVFTNWQAEWANQVWLKRRCEENQPLELLRELWGAQAAQSNVHPLVELSAEPCTPQMGEPGPWYDRLPHFRLDQTPSNGAELQSEYFVPRQHAIAAVQAVAALGDLIRPHLLISELRTVAADDLWLSPAYQRDILGIHFTWKRDWPAVKELLPQIEAALAPFAVVPHWGKLFTIPAEQVRAHYSKLPDFVALAQRYDPRGAFRNPFINTFIFGEGAHQLQNAVE